MIAVSFWHMVGTLLLGALAVLLLAVACVLAVVATEIKPSDKADPWAAAVLALAAVGGALLAVAGALTY